MGSCKLDSTNERGFCITGSLDYQSVPQMWDLSQRQFPNNGRIDISLQGVTRSDSAGIALLVAWTRWARHQQLDLILTNIPAQTRALIDVNGLTDILPLATG